MTFIFRRGAIKAVLCLAPFAIGTVLANAQELKTIDPPQGGKIVYGQVAGQTTEAGAMGSILRSLHDSLGDRPQVGKLFQVRGTESVAAFFSVTRKKVAAGQSPSQIAGMIIVTKVSSDHVEAALVSDDAARFPKTVSPMMKTLFGVWHPLQGGGGSATGSGGPLAPLHSVTLSDNSAMISLPAGWQLVPQMSQMGSIVAQGPNGESAEMGITFLASDPNNPAVRQTMQTLQNGGLRNTAYATASYIPYESDMSKSFVFQIQKVRQQAGLQPAVYNFTSVTPMGQSPQERCVHMQGTVDFKDGKGLRETNILYCAYAPNRFGGWMSVADMTSVPMQLAPKERATLGAVLASFQVNMAVVNRQANQIAKPEIDKIHEIGRAAAQQAKDAHEREDIQNSSVYKHWDDMDKRSQDFENYQLGYSVISTTDHTAHGTFWNEDADAIVKQHPDKYEYVNAPDYWKGIDY